MLKYRKLLLKEVIEATHKLAPYLCMIKPQFLQELTSSLYYVDRMIVYAEIGGSMLAQDPVSGSYYTVTGGGDFPLHVEMS